MDSPATLTVVVLLVVFALGVMLGAWTNRHNASQNTDVSGWEEDAMFGVDGLNYWATNDEGGEQRIAEVVVSSVVIEGCRYPQYSVTLCVAENDVAQARHPYLSAAVDKAIDEAEQQLTGGRYE